MRKRQYEVGEMQGGLKTAGKGKANAPLYRRQFQLFDDRFNSTKPIGPLAADAYSTVTDFAKLRGWSTSVPLSTAT